MTYVPPDKEAMLQVANAHIMDITKKLFAAQDRIAELEAALEGIFPHADDYVDEYETYRNPVREEHKIKMQEDLKRARDALAKETTCL